ncbi:unnamed protein product [Alopecurus aequalis]
MPPRMKRTSAPPVSVADRIGALPDHLLHHLLSFLPVQAAVRTCVLARRWRHLWRSTTSLRILADNIDIYAPVQDLRKFMDHLLVLRERTDLDTVEIKFSDYSKDDALYVNLWIRFAVMCKVRVLTLHGNVVPYLRLHNLPFVSQHLRILDLDGVALQETLLNFTSCPALEDLKMTDCAINAGSISSGSLKHLSISGCQSYLGSRVHISTPGLVSLKLVGFLGRTPFLENMALLETAHVELGEDCEDVCLNYDSGVLCGANNNACQNCVPNNDDCSNCVLLGGVSGAKHLKLISETGKAPDLDPLACILKHAPVLEKLTLQLFCKGPNHKMEMKGSYSSAERSSAISEHLNIVEVKCNVVDEKIFKVLKFMCSFNIRFSFE